MFRVYAATIATEMVKFQILWNWANKKFVGYPMGFSSNFSDRFSFVRTRLCVRQRPMSQQTSSGSAVTEIFKAFR